MRFFCTQVFSNFDTHASFPTVFLEDLADKKAHVLMERWRPEYNTFRPHSSLNYRPPAPEAYLN
jgi:transposase InsO family protein